MMTTDEINQAVREAAAAALQGATLTLVANEPTTDSDGWPALQITIVFKEGATEVSGDDALDALVGVRNSLLRSGEERFPILTMVTDDDWHANVDPES